MLNTYSQDLTKESSLGFFYCWYEQTIFQDMSGRVYDFVFAISFVVYYLGRCTLPQTSYNVLYTVIMTRISMIWTALFKTPPYTSSATTYITLLQEMRNFRSVYLYLLVLRKREEFLQLLCRHT